MHTSPGYISLRWMRFTGPCFPLHRCGSDWEVYVQYYKCELWHYSSSTFLSSILNLVASKWLRTSPFLPGESHGERSLVGYSPRGRKESDMMKQLSTIKRWSCSIDFATPWTIACQVPLTLGFFRQEYWSGLRFPSPSTIESISQ